MYVGMYVCMYVWMYECMVCMYRMNVCMYVWMYVCMYEMYVWMYVWMNGMNVCMYECMYVWMYECMYECMYYVWMYVCMNVWMYECMNVCMCSTKYCMLYQPAHPRRRHRRLGGGMQKQGLLQTPGNRWTRRWPIGPLGHGDIMFTQHPRKSQLFNLLVFLGFL